MSNMMTYKGYSARIEYDDEDGILCGQIVEISDGVGFHAESVGELRAAFHEAVDDYIETCGRLSRDPFKAHAEHGRKKHYKSSELLKGREVVSSLNSELAETMDGDAVGREVS